MYVHGLDGRYWRVGRSLLPWRPRLRARRWLRWFGFKEDAFALERRPPLKPRPRDSGFARSLRRDPDTDPAVYVFFLLYYGTALLPLTIATLVFAVEWLVVAVVAGFLAAARLVFRGPWLVEARPVARNLSAADLAQAPPTYVREIYGWRASGVVAAEAAQEIVLHNVPGSLDPKFPTDEQR